MATARQLLLLKRADLINERDLLLSTKTQIQERIAEGIAAANARLAEAETNIDEQVAILNNKIQDINQAIIGL